MLFFSRTWPAITLILGTGALSGILTTSISGIFAGAFLGPKSLLALSSKYVLEQPILEAGFAELKGKVLAEAITSSKVGTFGPTNTVGNVNLNIGTEGVYKTITLRNADSLNLATKEGNYLLEYVNPAGKVEVVELSGVESSKIVQAGVEPTATAPLSTFGAVLQVLSVLAWLYTIYNLVDYFGKEDKEETFTIGCNPWVAPSGGEDCEKCNEDGKTCSEYRCRSLGKLCRLINEGSDEERCVAQTSLDTNSPIISAVKIKNLEIDEKKNQGYIVKTLIKPFTPVELGISTDEPSKCKFDLEINKKYEDMRFDFGDSLFRYNHTMLFSLPGDLQNESILRLTNGGKYNLYLRCSDNNDNENNKDYYIKFEIDKGPDLTAPKIELTSLKNNGFVSNELKEVGLDIFVNEPSECKWDKKDSDYDLMGNSFICARSSLDVTPINQGLYRCSALLNNLQKGKNSFYFRCKDKPLEKEGRNVNKESFKFDLIKAENLVIDGVEPKGKVFRANPKLVVKTSKGSENGLSICGYSTNKDALISNIPQFADTNLSSHEQQLRNLVKGKYTYYITCVDSAGNIAKSSTQFEIATSLEQPVISRVYKDVKNNVLVVGTNEDSNCEYETKEFLFGEGIKMTDPDSKIHEAALTNNIYFVKCKDAFNNEGSVVVYP